MSVHDDNKFSLAPLGAALYAGGAGPVREAPIRHFAPDAQIRLCHPSQGVNRSEDLWARVYASLLAAMPDMERRDFIVMSGPRWGAGQSGNWIGLGGNTVGTLIAPYRQLGVDVFARMAALIGPEGAAA